MAAALRRLFTRFSRRERSVTWRGCPCTDEGEFPVVLFDGALPGELSCLQVVMLSGCCFHTPDRSRYRVSGVVASVTHSPRWWDDISS